MRFDTLLIANRGEIALRVIRAARELGLKTVAVYSDADAQARHVREADLAARLGPPEAHASYRNIEAILRACEGSGAQAVHPGYGFLSENADFARAVTQAGLTFVGPSAEVIALMGNKARAKEAMQGADVPTVPGGQGMHTEREAAALARSIGYPVILKAAAGGGGRGMRLAHTEAELLTVLPLARSEAAGAFGSDELIMEKALVDARHIEIQVLCDAAGNCVHLGERDCSLQRRYQKLVEESPSPAVGAALRDRMGAVAVRACQAIGYVGVGTLEFLLQGDDFYFMEMNTRLQVEHGVTELVTGIDLVQWQLRIAQGEPLSLRQEDVRLTGHAIELRICAEDAANGFVPQVGTVRAWREPGAIRVDSALETGTAVSPFYDSMVAKFLAWAPDRAQCTAKLALACEQTVLLGLQTNLGFLRQAIRHPSFREGRITTGFLSTVDPSGADWRPGPTPFAEAAAILALLGLDRRSEAMAPALTPMSELLVERPHDTGGDDDPCLVRVRHLPDDTIEIQRWNGDSADGSPAACIVTSLCRDGDDMVLVIDGLRRRMAVAMADATTAWVQDGAHAWSYRRSTRFRSPRTADTAGVGQVRAPVSGRVVSVEVQAGSTVHAKQTVLVLESMKLEMPIAAGMAGTLKRIGAAAGDQVSTGQILMEIER